REASRINDMGFAAARPQPPRQPEPVTTGLKRHNQTLYGMASLCRLVTPAMQLPENARFVRLQLLQRRATDARHDSGDKPALQAHLDHRDQRAILVEGG